MVVAAAGGGGLATKQWPFPRAKPTKPFSFFSFLALGGGPATSKGHIKRQIKNIITLFYYFYF
jgi:hypothetical protein